jgi:hypothetical protein
MLDRAAPRCSWVAHPALIPVAMKVFDEHMKTPNQIHVKREASLPSHAHYRAVLT